MAIAVLGGIVSCARLTLQEEPTAIPDPESTKGGFPDGFPDIQGAMDASLDKVIAVVDAAAARNVGGIPGMQR